MRIVFWGWMICLFSQDAFAALGREEGGGDPEAYVFVARLQQAAKILEQMPKSEALPDPAVLRKAADEILLSLDDKNPANDLVEFTAEKIMVGGVEKPAMYDGDLQRIRVHKKSWLEYEQAGQADRQRAIAVLEALLLQGIVNQRYTVAGKLIFVSDSNVESLAPLVDDRKPVLSFEDCDDSATYTLPSGKVVSLVRPRSSLNVRWLLGDREFTLRNYYPRLDGSGNDPLAARTLSYFEKSADGKTLFINEKSLISLSSAGVLSELSDKTKQDASLPDTSAVSEDGQVRTHRRNTFRRPDGGLVKETRYSDRVDPGGTKVKDHLVTCTHRFLGEKWAEEARNASFVSRINRFQKQFERVRAAEIAYDFCRAEKRDCALNSAHLQKIDADTLPLWKSLVKKSDFQAEAKTLQKKMNPEKRRARSPQRIHRSRDRYRDGVSPEDEAVLRRAQARSRLHDCASSIRNGGGCDLGNTEDILDAVFGGHGLR
jgi:hypothetical protein